MNLLQKLNRAKYHEYPFEHLIIHDFFTEEEYIAIEQEYPSSKKIHDEKKASNQRLLFKCKNNKKYLQYLASQKENLHPEALLQHLENGSSTTYSQNTTYAYQTTAESCKFYNLPKVGEFSSDWQNFIGPIMELIKKFKCFRHLESSAFEEIQKHLILRSDLRSISPSQNIKTTSLGPHVDSPEEVLAGLIYLKHKNDSSSGGDLELYSLKDKAPKKFMSSKRRIPTKYVEKRKVFPYKRNVAIIFPNTLRAIHGVSPRTADIGAYDRRLINFTAELEGTRMEDYSLYFDKKLDQSGRYDIYNFVTADNI